MCDTSPQHIVTERTSIVFPYSFVYPLINANASINVFPARGVHTRGISQQNNPDRRELDSKIIPTGGK